MNKKTLCLVVGARRIEINIIDAVAFLFFTRTSLINFFSFFGIRTYYIAGIVVVFMTALLIIATITDYKNIKWDGVVLIISAILFFSITIRIHPEYQERFDDIYNNGRFSAQSVFSVGAGIYAYYIIRLFENNIEKLYRVFSVIPCVVAIGNIVLIITRVSEYRMDFGYHMSFAAILFMGQYLYIKKNRFTLIFSIGCMLLGVLYGSRACVIGYIVFITMYIIWEKKVTTRKIIIMILFCIVAIALSSPAILMGLYNIFSSIGVKSRTLYLLATGNVSFDMARQERLWPILIGVLNESPFTKIHGAYADRFFLPSYYPYAHNIALEILITFGKLLGGVILLIMILDYTYVFRNDKGKGGLLVISFGCFSICRLLVSTSFWIEPYFWAFLAMMVNVSKEHKKINPRLDKRGVKYEN
ncbi:O-antigen ligase family protein [Hungatella effluvii]|uniref:O-antigen ligase family protein n=1 Tax=Hungatella effluvii TaxID=1096246 RepID=UPI0022E8A796|nr:hypothetical protein [Hungatella effluvii]